MASTSESAVRLLRVNPYFVVDNVFDSAEYYRDVLGFHFHQFWGEPPSFVMVIRDGIQIMLHQPATPPAQAVARPNTSVIADAFDAYIYVNDSDGLFAEFRSRDAELLNEPTDQPHDCREFDVQDLNGYVLRFGEDLLK